MVSGSPSAATERKDFLRSEIHRHDVLYHRDAMPEITDGEYDRLKQELRDLESPSVDLGDVRSASGEADSLVFTDDRRSGSGAVHRVRMLSLEKAYSEADLKRFHERVVRQLGRDEVRYVVEPKFDGLAVSATFVRGKLERLVTRGDGDKGEDVTSHLGVIRNLPPRLTPVTGTELPAEIELRGEVFISLDEFRRINQEREDAGETSYVSPRNLAAGTLKAQSSEELGGRRLDIVFYGVGGVEPAAAQPSTQRHLLAQMATWGLPTVTDVRLASSLDELCSVVREIGLQRSRYLFPTDGAVVKIDAVEDQHLLGVTDHAPRWAIAYKFAPDREVTRLRAITLQVGRTGLITPVAELEPVLIGGASISRASLHNADEIARRDLRVGDFVVVERTGDVIPTVIAVDWARRHPDSVKFNFPSTCPACAEGLVQRAGQVSRRCVNLNCPDQLRRRIRHFVSPSCVNIRGFTDTVLDALVSSGRLGKISDLYRLRREDFAEVGRGEAALRLLDEIERSKHVELWRIVYGLGLPGVGTVGSKALAEQFGTLDALTAATPAQLARLNDFGEASAAVIVNSLQSLPVRDLVVALRDESRAQDVRNDHR